MFLDSVIANRLVVVIGCLLHWRLFLPLGPRIAHGKQVVGDAKPVVGKPEVGGCFRVGFNGPLFQ